MKDEATNDRKRRVSGAVYGILKALTGCPHFPVPGTEGLTKHIGRKRLFTVSQDLVTTAVDHLTDSVFCDPSLLPDAYVPQDQLEAYFSEIKPSVLELDHLGFCYTVPDQESERRRIIEVSRLSSFSLYEMESNDLARWYFIGNAQAWQEPMIELLPTLPNTDKDLPYWMPHIHIDIHTVLPSEKLTRSIREIFHGARKPVLYTDPEWGTHCVRMWLGTIAGVNIQLDVSTGVRNLKWVRNNLLHEIV